MKKIFLIVFFGLLLFPVLVQAAGLVPCGGTGEPSCQLCHFFVLFKNVLNFLLAPVTGLVWPLAILMIAIAGFMFLFAYFGPAEILPGGGKGGPAMLSRAKQIISSTIFGLLIIFGAWILINFFLQFIGINEASGSPFKNLPKDWWKIECPITSGGTGAGTGAGPGTGTGAGTGATATPTPTPTPTPAVRTGIIKAVSGRWQDGTTYVVVMATVKNQTNVSQQYVLELYNKEGKKLASKTITLDPGKTVTIPFSSIKADNNFPGGIYRVDLYSAPRTLLQRKSGKIE